MHTKPEEPRDTPELIITERQNSQYQDLQM